MSTDTISSVLIPAFPLMVAIAVACYKLLLVWLDPAQKQSRLQQSQSILSSLAQSAVHAAEQSGANGPSKKSQATEDIQTALKVAGLALPDQLVESAVESAVYLLNQEQGFFNTPAKTAVPAPSAA